MTDETYRKLLNLEQVLARLEKATYVERFDTRRELRNLAIALNELITHLLNEVDAPLGGKQ